MEMRMGDVREKVVKLELEEKGIVECRCKELEERCKKAEGRCLELELEYGKTKREKEALEIIVKALEMEKLGMEDELRNLKRENGREEVVDLKKESEEENRVLKLKIKNNVRESEKQMGENEVEEQRKRFKEVESLGLQMEEGVVPGDDGLQVNSSLIHPGFEEKVKILEVEGCLQEAATPYNDINDDDEDDLANIKAPCALDQTLVREKDTQSDAGQHCGETMDISSSKRKRSANVVTSDVDSDIDGNIPISKLTKTHHLEVIPGVESSELRDCTLTSSPTGIDDVRSTKEVEEENSEELELANASASNSNSKLDVSSGSNTDNESSSSDSMDFQFYEIMSVSKTNKNDQSKRNSEGEGEMLAAFTRDDVLCMKAVCALYRQGQQTKPEQLQKETFVLNQRGFNQCDALRGSNLAHFLTDGDPQSDVKKSVKELKKYDSEGVDVCHKFAIGYSKPLFEIYQKKEDPYFLATTTTHSHDDDQKSKDWDTFWQYIRGNFPEVSISMIMGDHVVGFLRYLDKFGETKVHDQSCHFFGLTDPRRPPPCHCPFRQAWGSLEAIVDRLRAAYEERGGKPGRSPFGNGA